MEKIKSAAIRQGKAIYVGKSHHDIIVQSVRVQRKMIFDDTQERGFVTDTDRFVDRLEAAIIAYNAGQIPERTDVLFSWQLFLEDD